MHKNENGTEDVCLMQINSSNFDGLARYGITREKLLDDPCTCVQVGAWILSEKIRRYGKTWRAVGAYNAKSENKRLQYVELVENLWKGNVGNEGSFGSGVCPLCPGLACVDRQSARQM